MQVTQLFENARTLQRDTATAEAVLAAVELKLSRQAGVVEQAMQQYKSIEEEAVICREAADAVKKKRDMLSRLLESIGSALDNFNLLQVETKVRLQHVPAQFR